MTMNRQIKFALIALVSLCAIFVPAHQAQKKSQADAVKKVDDKVLRQADARASD